MAEIILVRHGETEWNIEEIFRGRIDIDLNDTGIKQAELLDEHLSYVKIDAVYSSPLKRALKTAEMIASYHKLDVEITPGLIDFNYGKWQGLAHQEVKDKYKNRLTSVLWWRVPLQGYFKFTICKRRELDRGMGY